VLLTEQIKSLSVWKNIIVHQVQSPRRSINYEILQKLKNKFECPSKNILNSLWRVFMMNMIFGSQHVFSKAAAGSREKLYKNPVRWELCKIRLVFAASQSKNGKNLRRIKRERNVVKFWHNRLFKRCWVYVKTLGCTKSKR